MNARLAISLSSLLPVSVAVAVSGCKDDAADEEATSSGTTGETNGSSPTSEAGTMIPEQPDLPKADLGIDPPQACEPYCEVLATCLGQDAADCLSACTQTHEERSAVAAACVEDHEVLLGCVAALSCDDAAAWQTAAGTDYPCAAEEQAAELSCTPGADTPSQTCTDFCTTAESCGARLEGCLLSCAQAEQSADEIGPDCRAAQDDVFVCAAALSCEEFASWTNAEGDYPCQTQDEAFQTACIGQ